MYVKVVLIKCAMTSRMALDMKTEILDEMPWWGRASPLCISITYSTALSSDDGIVACKVSPISDYAHPGSCHHNG